MVAGRESFGVILLDKFDLYNRLWLYDYHSSMNHPNWHITASLLSLKLFPLNLHKKNNIKAENSCSNCAILLRWKMILSFLLDVTETADILLLSEHKNVFNWIFPKQTKKGHKLDPSTRYLHQKTLDNNKFYSKCIFIKMCCVSLRNRQWCFNGKNIYFCKLIWHTIICYIC